MNKNIMFIISIVTVVIAVGGAIIWVFSAQNEHGVVTLEGNESIVISFLALGILGLITTAISLTAAKEEGSKVSKKAIYSGLSLAIIFFLWRLVVAL